MLRFLHEHFVLCAATLVLGTLSQVAVDHASPASLPATCTTAVGAPSFDLPPVFAVLRAAPEGDGDGTGDVQPAPTALPAGQTATTCAGGVVPTTCAGGSQQATNCAGGTIVASYCPNNTVQPTNCVGGVPVPTTCAGVTMSTNCPGGTQVPSNCPGTVLSTYCPSGRVPTNCPGGTFAPTNCPAADTAGQSGGTGACTHPLSNPIAG